MTNIYDPAIDPYVAQPANMVVNGSFEVGYSFSPWTTHYTGTIPTMLVFDRSANKLYGDHAVILESNGGLSAYIKSPKIQATPGDVLYACCTGYISGPGNGGIHMFAGLSESVRGDFTTILPDVHENFVSTLFTASDAGDGTHVVIEYLGTSGYTIFDGIMVLNLTTYYGAGNEPSKATIDNNIATMAAPPINTGRFWVSTPSAPRNLSATFQTDIKEVTLEWDPPAVSGESGNITYDVYYKLSTDGSYTYWTNTDALSWTGTTPSFNASTNYDFKVTTRNSTYGAGESATVTQTTPIGPIAPSIPLLQNVFSTHMYVQVKRNAFDSTIPGVTHYEVYRDTVSGGSYPYVGIITPFSDPQAVLLDQPGAGTFYYKLARVGAWGAGAMSGYETITTPANPSAVGSLAGSFASGAKIVNLTWSVPTTPFGFPVLNYKIEKTGGNGSYIEYSATNSYTHTDSSNEFVSGQSHRFTVSATNNNDTWGPEVYIDLIGTVTNIPSSVSTGGFLPNAKTIGVTWVAPSTGATATGYRLFVSGYGINRQQWGGIITVPNGTVTSSYFEPKNYTYTFEVSTISVWGESSSTISCTANTPTPPPPNCTGSTATATGGVGSINVVWTFDNTLGMSGLDDWPIEVERKVTELNGTLITDWTARSSQGISVLNFTDSSLLIGKIYHYRVRFQSSAWGDSSTGIQTNCHSPGLPGPLYDYYAFQDSNPEGNALPLNWKGPVDSGYAGATMTWIIRRQTAAEEPLNIWTVVTLSGFGGGIGQWYGADATAKNWNTAYRYNIVGNNGMGVTEATTNYITTRAGPPAPTKIGLSMEQYRNLPYIRIEWFPPIPPEGTTYSSEFQTAGYLIERADTTNPTWDTANNGVRTIAITKWNDLSFYDPDIYAGVTYLYRISRAIGTYPNYSYGTPFYSDPIMCTMSQPTAAIITPGSWTNGTTTTLWYSKAVLAVSNSGQPSIKWFSVSGDPLPTGSDSPTYMVVGQYAKAGSDYVDCADTNHEDGSSRWVHRASGRTYDINGFPIYNNYMEAINLDFGTIYKVRQVLKLVSDGTILGYSNVVELSTYIASNVSFPNIFPNSTLQSGFTDTGTAETNYMGTIRRMNNSTTTKDVLASMVDDGGFETGRCLSMDKSYDLVTYDNTCVHSAAYKLPADGYFATRRYYIRANMKVKGSSTSVMWKMSSLGDRTSPESLISTTASSLTRCGDTFATSEVEQIEFLSGGTSNVWTNSMGAVVGDIMVFDLSAVFGGNEYGSTSLVDSYKYGDVGDNSAEINEDDMNNVVEDYATEHWWDFDYTTNALKPIFIPTVEEIADTNNISVGITSVEDGLLYTTAGGTSIPVTPDTALFPVVTTILTQAKTVTLAEDFSGVANIDFTFKNVDVVTVMGSIRAQIEYRAVGTSTDVVLGPLYTKTTDGDESYTYRPFVDWHAGDMIKLYGSASMCTGDLTGFKVTYNGPTSIEGGMDKSGYAPLTEYVLEYRTWRENEYTQVSVAPGDFVDYMYGAELEDLEPSSKYYIRYRYRNSAGVLSNPSDYVVYTTPPAPPKLTGVSVQRGYIGGKAEFKFSWDTPEDEELETTAYYIYLGTDKNTLITHEFAVPASIDGRTSITMGASGTAPDTLISANTLYYYRIAAKNIYGAGRRSDLYSIMSTTVPGKPLNLFASFERNKNVDNNPTILWDAPLSDGGAGDFGSTQDFTKYKILLARTLKGESSPTWCTTPIEVAKVDTISSLAITSTSSNLVWVKLKTITLSASQEFVGVVRMSFDIYGTGGTYYGEIRRNGVLIGSSHSSVAYVAQPDTITESLTVDWNTGDTIELWGRVSKNTAVVYLSNFTIDYDLCYYTNLDGHETYKLNKFDTIFMQVAAVTNYATGAYAGPVSVTFAEIEELIRFRGYAETPGKIKLEFSERESFQQPVDADGNPMYWVVTGGSPTDDIPAGSTLQNIQNCIKNSSTNPSVAGNIYAVSTVDTGETQNEKKGWPIFVNTEKIGTFIGVDPIGEYLDVAVYMYPFRPENDNDTFDNLYDIYTSNIGVNGNEGLTGLNTLMIVSDYTTDISFRDDDTQTILSGDAGWLQFRVDAAIVSSNRYVNESVPQSSKVFKIPIADDSTLDDIKQLIYNYPVPLSDTNIVYLGLEGQINQFFLDDPVLGSLYTMHQINDDSGETFLSPFKVSCTYYNEPETNKRHLKINIRGINEDVEAQISAKTTGVSNMITVTKPNTYLVKENTYELRSFEDMYGRNKPGSSTVNSTYVRRSYGFKFDLDYITGYQEVEKANIDVTAIPGMSSAFNIGIDAQGTTRTITIDGTRVDNSNIWMFHCPYEYQLNQFEGDPAVEEGGVIYTGTSNWGWTKFMKALLGTFQFIDGPYRLVIMTVPSSSMSQYVLDRNCKYQYVDGTYIIKAGYEDMCYVMIDQFQTVRTDGKYNAIDYQLILKRVTPLGSAP